MRVMYLYKRNLTHILLISLPKSTSFHYLLLSLFKTMQARLPLEFLHALQIPLGERCIIGGKCLELRGVRQSEDVDLLVSKKAFASLLSQFPSALQTSKNWDQVLIFPQYTLEIFRDLPAFYGREDEVLQRSEIREGIPYLHIDDLIVFKQHLGRQKDLHDIALLQQRKKTQSWSAF